MRPEDTQMASGRVDEPDITIPRDALEAAKSAYTAAIYRGNGTAREYHEAMSAACIAMLKNWPGMHIHEWHRPWLGGMNGTDIVLPLPQEGA